MFAQVELIGIQQIITVLIVLIIASVVQILQVAKLAKTHTILILLITLVIVDVQIHNIIMQQIILAGIQQFITVL